MSDAVIVGIITLTGTLVSVFVSAWKTNKLVNYRVDQLEKKVSEHNGIKECLTEHIHNADVRFEGIGKRMDYIEDGLCEVKRKIGA